MKRLLTLTTFLAVAANAQAAVILNDNFTSGTTYNDRQSLSDSASWYVQNKDNGASLSINNTAGTLTYSKGTASANMWGYFTDSGTLGLTNVGDSITLSLTFTGTTTGSDIATNAFRLGLLNSGGGATRVEADVSGNLVAETAFNGWDGYAVFLTPRPEGNSQSVDSSIQKRTGTNDQLFSSSAFTQVGSAVNNNIQVGSTSRTLVFTIEKTGADAVSLIASYAGSEILNVTDSSSIFDSFDAFAFSNFNGASSVDPITFSNISVTTAVPEPSTYAILAGMMALGLVMLRRRMH